MAQADGTIQNDTGANVRSDLNNNFSALFTNNSGASAPGTTFAYMWYADTTNNLLKIRNGANDGFITVGDLTATNLGLAPQASPTFTGNVTIPAGTSALPSLRFTGDTDTGIYSSAANHVNITASGTLSHTFSNNYSTASVPVRVPDGSAAAPGLTNTGDENTGIFFGAADELSITTGGTERAQFDSNGLSILAQKPVRYYDADNSHYVELKAASSVAANVSLTLPTGDGDADQFLKTDGSGNLSFASPPSGAYVPTGSVFMMATTTVPSGYLECDGSAVSRTTYADLFSAISTTWGSGNGSTTFNLPDLRGEFVRGWASDRRGDGVDPNSDSGRSFASSQADSITDHTHVIRADGSGGSLGKNIVTANNDSGEFDADGGFNEYVKGIGTFKSGSSTTATTETRPRNIAMMYVIKT